MTAPCIRSTFWLFAAALCLPAGLAAQRAPTNVTAVDGRGGVTISWTGIRAEVTYRVLRSPDQKSTGEDLTRPLQAGSTWFVDPKVSPGVLYYYQVIAVYGDGTEGASVPIPFQLGMPVAAPVPAPAPPPPAPPPLIKGAALPAALPPAPPLAMRPAPTGISIIGTPAQAMVKWQPMTGVTSIVVTRRESNGSVKPMTLPGSSTGWTDKGLRPGTTYTYSVDAVYPTSQVASAQAQYTTPPAVNPSWVSGVPAGVGQVKLTWQPVLGADYYIVLGPGSSFGGTKVTGLTTYSVTGAPAGPQTWAVGSYYDPGPNVPGVLVSPNAVSTPGTQFPKVQVTVAAPPPPPPASTARRTNFVPGIHGFKFVNDFKNSFIGPPVSMTTGGLCGGMSYAMLDYFLAQKQMPGQWFRPANGTTIQQYLYGRQVTSLLDNLDKWGEVSVNPLGSRTLEFFNWGLNERLKELRSFIDRGVPVPLGLKGDGGPVDRHDHQVLAIGYDMGRYAGDLGNYKDDLKIFIVDPNWPGEIVTLAPNLGTMEFFETTHTSDKWRTYFVDGKYQPMTPPNAVNPVYPVDNLVHELRLEFDTGQDDMRGGPDHVDITVRLANGTSQYYPNISQNGIWLPGYRETAQVFLSQAVPESSIKLIEIVTNATGGVNGDNWDMASVGIRGLGGNFEHSIIGGKRVGPYRFTGARTPFLIPVH